MGNPEIVTIDDFLTNISTDASEEFMGLQFVFYQGMAYAPDEMSEFTQEDDVVLTDIIQVSGIDSVQYRVRGNDFVMEYSTGLDEAFIVIDYIFAYDHDAAETDVPTFDIDRNSYQLDSVELTELSQFGREELIRQYKLEFGDATDATDEEIIEFFEQMYAEMFSQDYAYVTATDGMMFLIDSSNEGYVDLQYVQDGASIEMSNPDALSGEPLFSATTRGNKLYVEIVLYFEDVARDAVFTLEYTLCDFIDPPVATFEPTKPDLEPTVAINGEMTSSEMLQAALDNYYGADFALQKKYGSIETEMLGMPVVQYVESVTIRDDGAADGNLRIYTRNQSATVSGSMALFDVRYWDEIDYIKSGSAEEVYRRTVGASDYKLFTIHDKNNALIDWWLGWTEGESYASPTKYNSLNSFVAQNAFDPTAIWMYDLSQQNITTMTDPVYHADRGTYTFDVALSAEAAANYAEWWRAVLVADDQNAEIEFTSVTLKFEIWDNGFLKSVTAQDNVSMKVSIISCGAVLETKTDFYFERNNLPSAFDDDAFDTSRLGEVKEYYDTVGGTEVPDNDAFDVNGKTFTIVSCDIPYVTPEQEQALMDEEGWTVDDYLARVNETFLGFELSFASGGSVTAFGDTGTYTYTQDGNLTIEFPNAGLSMDGDVRIDGEMKLRFRLDLDIQIFVTAQAGR